MQLTRFQIEAFQQKILTWYQANKRDLPWRHTHDPYAVLVSEVMLQQTQVTRVIPKYEAWIARFPTVTKLAEMSTVEVLRLWSGLGYNRRALNLQKAAQAVVARSKNQELSNGNSYWPQTVEELSTLPGVGKYTAAAIACFAFDQQIAVIDTNIRKVIATTFFAGRLPTEKCIEEIATQLLPKGKAYDWNQALMDYSSLMLKKEKIPIPKQSRFEGSDRFYRGQTLKLLLDRHEIALPALQAFFQDKHPIASERLEKIMSGLQQDGFVTKNGQKISLAKQ